ncbi:hypothetical protein RJ640_018680 [Escallonia rubra]|uniref:Uncharacterized protein n=1 Tax=Escallonia rubra TaxID=112253 RepID=A0AA88RG62_9ASTE|nr:hypothetical protein RJ640_018680 [Escallonia rubra]
MDVCSVRENSQVGRSSSPKLPTLELKCQLDHPGLCSEPEEKMQDVQKMQKGPEGARVVESDSIIVEQLRCSEETTSNSSFGLLKPPLGDATTSNFESMEVLGASVTTKIPSPKKTTSGLNHDFDSESANCESLKQEHASSTENVQNGPAEIQKAECDNTGLEQVGLAQEETRNSCQGKLRPPEADPNIRCSVEQMGLESKDAGANPNIERLIAPPDDVSENPGPEQLGLKQEDARKSPRKSGHRKKGTPVQPRKRTNAMRSLVGCTRTLRSRAQEKSITPETSKKLAEDGGNIEKKRKKKIRMRKIPKNEFLKIKTHLKYLLNRMKYEQSLIDAYTGEGWKGQSLEKIKPEKELQRAKSEIFRCKLKIRDLFQRLDMSCAEGRLPESLFDSQGEIDSEDVGDAFCSFLSCYFLVDIFCAKCGSKDLIANNDIILCDGTCERGFHQFCLEPPLLKEDIPPGDQGWLCPGCDCKVDCSDMLNDSQGTILSISDRWENVFPEAAAAAAAGNKLDDSALPSDDSEDDDYDPDGPELNEKVQGDESSSDESDFSSASDDMSALPNNDQYLGLPSDDSEDDDYNPNPVEHDEQVNQEHSSSDFTSDSEDFGVVLEDNNPSAEVQGPMSSTSDYMKLNDERSKPGGTKRQSLSNELSLLLESYPGGDESAPLSGRRQVERLDYKKLHDETYGDVSSSDTSDEDFSDTAAPKRRKINSGEVASMSLNMKAAAVKHGADVDNLKESEFTPKRRSRKKLDGEGTSNSLAKAHKDSSEHHCSRNSTTRSSYKRLGEDVTQRLLESFKQNQYPERAVKEILAKDLALTFQQVDKWFGNARWSYRHTSRLGSSIAESALDKSSHQTKYPEPETKLVTEDAACNILEEKELPKAIPDGENVRVESLAEKGGNGVDFRTPKSGKRKVNLDHQVTDSLPNMDTPSQSVPVTSPNSQEVRRSGRIQSRNKEPAS